MIRNIFIILFGFVLTYYFFGYKFGYCIPYDNKCFILNLELIHNSSKMILDGEQIIKEKYKNKEDVIFYYLNNWNFNFYPTNVLMLAKILDNSKIDELTNKIFFKKGVGYNDYLISTILSNSGKNADIYLGKYPYILSYENDNSPIIRSGFVWFIYGLDKQKSIKTLNDMLKIEKDDNVIINIKRALDYINSTL